MPRLERLGERSITIEAKRLGTLIGLQSGASGPHAILGPSHSDSATTALARGDILGCVGSATLDAINIGGSGTYLRSDGTDSAWTALQTADMPALPTPGTCTVATSNSGTAPHTHAITSSSNPGAAASLLASDASGYLQLERLGLGTSPSEKLHVFANDNVYVRVDSGSGSNYYYSGYEFTHDDTRRWVIFKTGDSSHDLELAAYNDAGAKTATAIRITRSSAHVGVGSTNTWALLDVRQSTTSGPTINAYRDLASGSTDSPVLRVVQDNAGDDQYAAYIQGDGSADVLVIASGHASARAAQFSRNSASATAPVVYIAQTNSGGVDGCLHLYQNDVDQHFIEFQSTASSGDLTRAIVDEGDQSSETREGWLKVEVTDGGGQVTSGDYFVPFYSLS